MITLKHLARDFSLDPYTLRMALRNAGLQPPSNRRWRWETDQDPHYQKCQQVAVSKASSLATSKLAKEHQAAASAKTRTPLPLGNSSVQVSGASLSPKKSKTPTSEASSATRSSKKG